MTNHVSLLAGLLVGLSIAAPIGPMGLLCIQRTLASGMRVGVSTGLGAATVNVLHGAALLAGMQHIGAWGAGGGRVLNALGGLFLLGSAARTVMRRQTLAPQARQATPSPLAAYGSAVAFNMTNPMALILIMALFTPILGTQDVSVGDGALLLLGMFLAAATWWVCLSFGVALLRARLSPAVLRHVNHGAGLVLTFYGALALARSAGL